jgi:RNA polymerase sigma-70 factor (ECF subfamily)
VSSSSLPGVWRAATASSRAAGGASPLPGDAAAPEARAEGRRPGAALDLRTLFERHHASIWRLLRRLGVTHAQLDDAAQEVFWVVARKLEQIEPGKQHAFLYGVALRVAASEVRRRTSLPPAADSAELERLATAEPTPEEQLEQRRARELLDAVLDALPLELRSVLVLFELEGLDVRSIAEIEGIPMGTVGSRLRRAREEFSAVAKRVRAGCAPQRSP